MWGHERIDYVLRSVLVLPTYCRLQLLLAVYGVYD